MNGKTEFSVAVTEAGTFSFAIDGDFVNELIFFDDLNFSVRDQPSIRGRFLRDPISGDLERIQIGLYVGRRQSAKNETSRLLCGVTHGGLY